MISFRGWISNNSHCSRQTGVLSQGPCCSTHPEASASDQPPFPASFIQSQYPPLVRFPDPLVNWGIEHEHYLGARQHLVEMAPIHKLSWDVSQPGCPPANVRLRWILLLSPAGRAHMAGGTRRVLLKHLIQLGCCDRVVPTFSVVFIMLMLKITVWGTMVRSDVCNSWC